MLNNDMLFHVSGISDCRNIVADENSFITPAEVIATGYYVVNTSNLNDHSLDMYEFYWNNTRVGYTTGASAANSIQVADILYSTGDYITIDSSGFPNMTGYYGICKTVSRQKS